MTHQNTAIFYHRFAVVNVAFSAVAYYLIDPLGRRTLLLASLALMLPPLVALVFRLGSESSLACILAHAAVYSPGAGVGPSPKGAARLLNY